MTTCGVAKQAVGWKEEWDDGDDGEQRSCCCKFKDVGVKNYGTYSEMKLCGGTRCQRSRQLLKDSKQQRRNH